MSQPSNILGTAGEPTTVEDDNIYIDLDCLLDTRLGTLSKLGTDLATKALQEGQYLKRLSDNFTGVTKADFDAAYAKRDLETLQHSVLTNAVFFMQRIIKDSLLSAVMQAKVENVSFTVNIYPYDVNDPDFIDMLIGCVRFHTYSTATINVVSLSDAELTPSYCKDNYQIMIRYHWLNWVNEHKAYFETKGIPSVTVVAPEMFIEEVPTKEKLVSMGLKGINPFEETVRVTAPLFRLKFMPVSMFSIHEQITKDNASKIASNVAITEDDIKDHLDKNHPEATLVRDNPLPVVNLDEAFQLF